MGLSAARFRDLCAAQRYLKERFFLRRGGFPRAPSRIFDILEWLPWNVHSMALGRKSVNQVESGPWCVQFFVDRKLASSRLPLGLRIPTSIDGLPTDVIECPRARLAHASRRSARREPRSQERSAAVVLADEGAGDPSEQVRPMSPGCSIGHMQSGSGSLGALCGIVGVPDAVFALSNCHVLADSGAGTAGDLVLQPGPAHASGGDDLVALLGDYFRPLVSAGAGANTVDIALARILGTVAYNPEIPTIGRIAGTLEPSKDLLVRKRGAKTGTTHGRVAKLEWTGDLTTGSPFGTIGFHFEHQIRIDPSGPTSRFAARGDSGSLVVTEEDPVRAVGLLCGAAIDDTYGIASPISAVLDPAIGFPIEFL